MRKKATSTNRAGTHPALANVNLAVLPDAALSCVKGGGDPQQPTLVPGNPTDPVTSS